MRYVPVGVRPDPTSLASALRDLRGEDLSALTLVGADLRRVDLRDTRLAGRDLTGADLRGACLDGADLSGARLVDADLRGARLRGARLGGADLSGADARGVDFTRADLRAAVLRDVDLVGGVLDGADARDADLRRSEGYAVSARGVRLARAVLDGAAWRLADLREADLDEAQGTGARFDRAQLAGATARAARLERSVFDEADIEQFDLSGARLRGAAFFAARGQPRVEHADLRGADLRFDAVLQAIADGAGPGRLEAARIPYGHAAAALELLGGSVWRAPVTVRLALAGSARAEAAFGAWVTRLRDLRGDASAESDGDSLPEVGAVSIPREEAAPQVHGAGGRGRAGELLEGWRGYLFDPVDTATVDVEAELAFARAALERDHESRRGAMGGEALARLGVRRVRRAFDRAQREASATLTSTATATARARVDARLASSTARSARDVARRDLHAASERASEPGPVPSVVPSVAARVGAATARSGQRASPDADGAPSTASPVDDLAGAGHHGTSGRDIPHPDASTSLQASAQARLSLGAHVAVAHAAGSPASETPFVANVAAVPEALAPAVPSPGAPVDVAAAPVGDDAWYDPRTSERAALRASAVARVGLARSAASRALPPETPWPEESDVSGAPPRPSAAAAAPVGDDAWHDPRTSERAALRASAVARVGLARSAASRALPPETPWPEESDVSGAPPTPSDALSRSASLRTVAATAWRARVRDAVTKDAAGVVPAPALTSAVALRRSAEARVRRVQDGARGPTAWERLLELLREPRAAEPSEDEVAAFAVAAQERDAEWARATLASARYARLERASREDAAASVVRAAEADRSKHEADLLEARLTAEARLRAGVIRHRRHDLAGAREEFVAARVAAAAVALRAAEAPAEGPDALPPGVRTRWVRARVLAAERRALSGRLDEERSEVLGLFTELSAERDAEVEAAARAVWRRAAILRAESHADVVLLPRAPGALAARAVTRLRLRRGAKPLALGPAAQLEGADLEGRALVGVDLRGARMARARLVSAELRDALLSGADLHGADLSGATLDGADLSEADLRGAILEGASLRGTRLDGARVEGATLLDVQGLAPEVRAALLAGGADLGQGDEGRWFRVASGLVAVSLGAVVAVYLVARFTTPGTDDASIEQAATVAKQEGDPREAAARFVDLAARADTPEARVSFLLEAAAAFEDAGDTDAALARYAEAMAAAEETSLVARVLLRRAGIERRVGLATAAEQSYRALLARVDATPSELGDALAGLASVLGAEGEDELAALQERLLAAAPTPVARAGLALALADGWAGQGHLDRARTTLQVTLERGLEAEDALPLQLRLAHVLAQDGRGDEALALYRSLADVAPQARLGAAEILAKRGEVAEARDLLAPLLAGGGEAGARARLAVAAIAARENDDATATRLLREVLAADGLEPRMADEARLLLARLLITKDPAAAAALADANPQIRGAILLGQARALRDAGNRTEARARWVTLSEDASLDPESRAEAALALAELDIEDGEADSAVRRYEQLMEDAQQVDLRRRVQIGYGAALVRLGRVQEAEARYRALADASGPGDVRDQAELGLARCAALRGQAAEAAQRFEAVAAREGAWGAEALLALGELREDSGDLEGAVAALRRARTRTGLEADRRTLVDIRLARVLDALGDPAAAQLYETLLAAPDANVRVQARLAVAGRTVAKDPRAARDLYEAALQEIGPGAERAVARAGWLRASVALGDTEAGIARIRAWLETERDPALRGELAIAAVRGLRAEGRAEEALVLGERWAADGGFELAMERAGALRELGRATDAARVLASVKGGSSEDEGWRLEARAEALLASGDLDAAEDTYNTLGTSPGGADAARLGRARIARERGELDAALALLSEASDPRAPMERAQVLEELGRISEAETTWKRVALSTDAEQRSAGAVGLARVRLSRDDAKGALEALSGVSAPDPGYALTHAQARGEALLALGRFDEARAVYAALDADAESRVVGLLGQAEVDLAVDRPRDALPRFERALSAATDPWYQAVARGGIVRALAEAGDSTKATAAYAALREAFPERDDVLSGAAAALGIER